MDYLHLIRYPNLIIVSLTQFLLGYFLLYPTLVNASIQPSLERPHFFLLIFVTCLITATGYMINDFYDLKVDQTNRPHKTYVRHIGVRRILILYAVLVATGMLLALYLANLLGQWYLSMIYVIVQLILFLYSYKLKSIPGLGNIVVSLLCAGVIYIVWFGESSSLNSLNLQNESSYAMLRQIFLAFALFAFFITAYREIIKDMEDLKGDTVEGKRTLAVAYGIRFSKSVAYSICSILLASILVWIFVFNVMLSWSTIFLILFVVLPLFYSLYLLLHADDTVKYARISKWIKWVMLFGLIYVFMYYKFS